MRRRSRELRELIVRVLAGLGLVLALAVMGAVLVSTAVTGDERTDGSVALPPGGGLGASAATAETDQLSADGTDPSHTGVLLGAVLLAGGNGELGLDARRSRSKPPSVRQLQAVAH